MGFKEWKAEVLSPQADHSKAEGPWWQKHDQLKRFESSKRNLRANLSRIKTETVWSINVVQISHSHCSCFLQEKVLCTHVFGALIFQHLRQAGIAGKFVEFFGPGVSQLSAPDRTTIANMCPEYNATVSFFPIDQVTLKHFKKTRESPEWECCCFIKLFFFFLQPQNGTVVYPGH